METITLKIPDNAGIDRVQLVMLIAGKLYEQGKLSLGQAAEMAGISKRSFTELLGLYGFSIFNFPPTELSQDICNA